MYYYDSGGGDFIDISSPCKLRKEKQQDDKALFTAGFRVIWSWQPV